jgi:hypothetical protein
MSSVRGPEGIIVNHAERIDGTPAEGTAGRG